MNEVLAIATMTAYLKVTESDCFLLEREVEC